MFLEYPAYQHVFKIEFRNRQSCFLPFKPFPCKPVLWCCSLCAVTGWTINHNLWNCRRMELGKGGSVPITGLAAVSNWNEMWVGWLVVGSLSWGDSWVAAVHRALSGYLNLSLAELQQPLRIFICKTMVWNLRGLNQLSEHCLCWTASSPLHIDLQGL